MPGITPYLWFDTQAEEAAKFYVAVFKNSKLGDISYYGNEGTEVTGKPAGEVMTVAFELDGREFLALNGGPAFKFTEAISFMVSCKDQAEVDYYWDRLTSDGGCEVQCGWLKDKYGLSWQIIPEQLSRLLNDPARAKADRVVKAMLQMKKIDIPTLEKAAGS